MSGKGSSRRGTDKASTTAYREGWDRIFGSGSNPTHVNAKRVQPKSSKPKARKRRLLTT
jgi:hypothetical protein